MNLIEIKTKEPWPNSVIIFTDGASRGNPGPASYGFAVQDSIGEIIYERADTLGDQTNNFAEYTGVLKALELAQQNAVKHVVIKSDSELMVKQMTGIYRVKSAVIKPLYLACKELISSFEFVSFEHVRREYNKRADKLANMALDQI